MKNNSALFYTCSLIEFIGRQQKQKRAFVVENLGADNLERIYNYADIFHCEVIEKVANDFIEIAKISEGNYDNISECNYTVPDYWTIGEVYERLIEDISEKSEKDVLQILRDVYFSWIDDAISNYNSDFYYQPRDYICVCYEEGKICA